MQPFLCLYFIILKQPTIIFRWFLSSEQRRRRSQDNIRALFTKYINMLTVNSDVASKGTTSRPYQFIYVPTQPIMRMMCEGWPYHQNLRPLLVSNSGVRSFASCKNQCKCCETAATVFFTSLSETTRKSNRLKMSLQRQHFLLSYLKAVSVNQAGIRTFDLPLNRTALSQLD